MYITIIQPYGCNFNTIIWLCAIIYLIGGIHMKKYNDIIRELREDHDLTQADVAKILGTSQQIYSRYELGSRELPIKHLITLCKYYGVSSDYILCLKI